VIVINSFVEQKQFMLSLAATAQSAKRISEAGGERCSRADGPFAPISTGIQSEWAKLFAFWGD
jgi:hypothetical protein